MNHRLENKEPKEPKNPLATHPKTRIRLLLLQKADLFRVSVSKVNERPLQQLYYSKLVELVDGPSAFVRAPHRQLS